MELTGTVALVTGGAKRVGRASALRLAEAGADVALTYRRSEREARTVAGEIEAMGRAVWTIPADLADPDAAEPLAETIRARCGRLDVLVHNASVFQPTAWGRLTAAGWRSQMTVNALSPVLLTQALDPLLRTGPGGRVIHLLDMHVLGRPRAGFTAYNASKAALLEMTYSLAMELAPEVTVNGVAPGVVAWDEHSTEAEREAYLRRVPLARPGSPEDAAGAVLYLARDADYLTGQVIRVDGGRWLG